MNLLMLVPSRHGFTITELSIALVIIGLVIVGDDLLVFEERC